MRFNPREGRYVAATSNMVKAISKKAGLEFQSREGRYVAATHLLPKLWGDHSQSFNPREGRYVAATNIGGMLDIALSLFQSP